jgi:hypothetical protein
MNPTRIALPLPLLAALVPLRLVSAQTADTMPARVAERQISTFNRHDLDGFIALYADDAVLYEFPSGKVLAQGKAAIRERYAPVFKTKLPAVRVEPRIVNGAFVADNERWTAKPGERNQAVWLYDIRGGLIRKVWMVALQ